MDTDDVSASSKKVGKFKNKNGSARPKSKSALADEGSKVSYKQLRVPLSHMQCHLQGQEGTASYGLWECYSDHTTAGEEGALKNIRGFLLKKRKSPLKGWQKVCMAIFS